MTDRIIEAWRKFHHFVQQGKYWPFCEAAKFGGKPTRRAIQDHIRKLKTESSTAKSSKTDASSGGFPRTAPSTPSKTASSTVRKNTGTGSRRKRKTHGDSNNDDEYFVNRREFKDLTGSPTPCAELMDESPRKRRAASKRVSELIKQIFESDSEDEDEDTRDPSSEGSKMGSDGDEGYIDEEDEHIEDAEKVSTGAVEEAIKDRERPVGEDTGNTINIKSELDLEI